MTDRFAQLESAVARERSQLLSHPVYDAVRDAAALRRFMEAHVFAVWDFMALLKSLQRRLTCVDVVWTPPRSRMAARLINEIVLGEESDAVEPPLTMSHFELYLRAMRETGARTEPVDDFIYALRQGSTPLRTLAALDVPPFVHAFVEGTLTVAMTGTDEEVAASFLLGREDLVPAMFRRLLPAIAETRETESLRLYLARHIEVDEGEHGPLARRLLCDLCDGHDDRWERATEAARTALRARCALWDGVVRTLDVDVSSARVVGSAGDESAGALL